MVGVSIPVVISASVRARLEGRSPAAPYTLDDMADDAVRLLDWLGISQAHIVGTSMGGMIAQCITIRHPTHVLSLTSIMADAGKPAVPRPEAMIAFEPPAPERETYVTQVLKIYVDRALPSRSGKHARWH